MVFTRPTRLEATRLALQVYTIMKPEHDERDSRHQFRTSLTLQLLPLKIRHKILFLKNLLGGFKTQDLLSK